MANKRNARDNHFVEFLAKRERLNYDQIYEDATCCENCVDLKSYIDSKFDKLTSKLEMLEAQNSSILEALGASHTMYKTETLDEVTEEDAPSVASEDFPLSLASVISMFPLQSQECLVKIDKQICEENEDLFVDAVKAIVSNELKKHFYSLLSQDLVLHCNLRGTHGQTSFRQFDNFYHVLTRVIATDVDGPDPDPCLRKAFRFAKKYYYKKMALQKIKTETFSETFSDPLRTV